MLQTTDHLDREIAAAQSDPARYLVSLELSRSTWLVTTLAPDREKLSRHQIEGGDAVGQSQVIRARHMCGVTVTSCRTNDWGRPPSLCY
jgi:hypothetical protein